MLKNMIITNLQSCRKREKIQLQIHTGSWDKRTEALQQVVEKTKSISWQAGRQIRKNGGREEGNKDSRKEGRQSGRTEGRAKEIQDSKKRRMKKRMKKRKTDRKLGRRGRGKGRKEDKRKEKNERDGISFSITFPEVPHHIMPPSLLLVISSLRSILRSLQRETNKMQTMPTAKLDDKQSKLFLALPCISESKLDGKAFLHRNGVRYFNYVNFDVRNWRGLGKQNRRIHRMNTKEFSGKKQRCVLHIARRRTFNEFTYN